MLLLGQGKLALALTHLQRALAIDEQALGPAHPQVAQSLVGLAEIALAEHDLGAAREHAERAVSILEAAETSPVPLAEAHFVLAQALGSDGSQRAHARALAQQAREALAELGDAEAERLTEIEAWLAEHPAP